MYNKKNLKPSTPVKKAYVDNKALFEDIRDNYYPLVIEWRAAGRPGNPPPVTDHMSKAIFLIATNFCLHRKYYNLKPIHEDLAAYACLVVLKYIHNFNPEKYDKPFAYITMIVNNAFLQYLKKESKNNKAKTAALHQMAFDQMMAQEDIESSYIDLVSDKIGRDKMEDEVFDKANEEFNQRNS